MHALKFEKNESKPNLERMGAAELAEAIARGAVSSVEAVESVIARLEEANPSLNALVWRRYEEARAEAAQADRKRELGEPLPPLHGVPVTVKDSLDVAGTPSTFGVSHLSGHRSTADAEPIAALKRAGAIIVGKTNVAQALMYYETDNPLHGRTNHPERPERSPGGSSGGEAAVIAAGASPLGFGTDIGGSSRVPAAFCGIVGFKPTEGRLDDLGRGSFPLGVAIRSQVGVLGREVRDVALGLKAACAGGPRTLGDFASVDVAKLRIGWFDDDGFFAPAPAAKRAVREAVEALKAKGARVERWEPPPADAIRRHFFGQLAADQLKHISRVLGSSPRDLRVKQLEDAGAKPRMIVNLLLSLTGRKMTRKVVDCFGPHDADTLLRKMGELHDFRAQQLARLQGFDAIVSPPVPLPAVRHGATVELGVMGSYACLYNVLGWPAGVVPVTRVRAGEESDRPVSKDPALIAARESERESAGLPIGVQVAAAPWWEEVALAVMAQVASRLRLP